MQITATMVKELRDRTGAGMMECKKALTESSGDKDVAIEKMRKSGQAKADKKAGRIAAEGTIAISTSENAQQAAIVEVNCETDFVAKDEQFQAFSKQLSLLVIDNDVRSVDELNALESSSGQSVEQVRLELVNKIGENIQIRRFQKISSVSELAYYSHGNRIGVVVDVSGEASGELGKDVAMHIAASNPACIAEGDVPEDVLAKEKEIFMAQAESSGKTPEIIEKMVQGKLKKHLKEITLLGQPFVKDPDQTIEALLKSSGAEVKKFIRFEVGEGIEKRSENFADEVMAQVKQSEEPS